MEYILSPQLPAQQSESLDTLLPAFAQAQMNYPDFIKNRTGQFKYMDLVEMVGIVRPILFAEGLTFHHKQYSVVKGERILGTILYHFRSGQYIESRSWITFETNGTRSSHQEFGTAMSYHRRYELMALLNLTPEDSSDDDGQHASYTPRPSNNLASEKQRKLLKRLLSEKKMLPSQYFKDQGIEKPEDLTSFKVSEMIKDLMIKDLQ